MTSKHVSPSFAIGMIVLTTLLWGAGFPVIKALGIEQRILLPTVNTLFASVVSLSFRFLFASICMLIISIPTLRSITRKELIFGSSIGFFIGTGAIFQIDGLNYTQASTSGFLTAFYVITVPLVDAFMKKKFPEPRIWICMLVVLAGIGILSGVNIHQFRLGRGEAQTLLASCFFCGQIIVQSKMNPDRDRWMHVTLIMCVTATLLLSGIGIAVAPQLSDAITMHASPRAVLDIALLAFFSTVIPFALANKFQPLMSPVVASIVYCAEPIFVSISAFFLPEILVRNPALYPNEKFTLALLIGGGLITIANILVQIPSRAAQHEKRRSKP